MNSGSPFNRHIVKYPVGHPLVEVIHPPVRVAHPSVGGPKERARTVDDYLSNWFGLKGVVFMTSTQRQGSTLAAFVSSARWAFLPGVGFGFARCFGADSDYLEFKMGIWVPELFDTIEWY